MGSPTFPVVPVIDCSFPASLLHHPHFCNDRVRESWNWSICKLLQGKKVTPRNTTVLFWGPSDWKENQDNAVDGLLDPAALLWDRQGILKRTLSELEISTEYWTNLQSLFVGGPFIIIWHSHRNLKYQAFLLKIIYLHFWSNRSVSIRIKLKINENNWCMSALWQTNKPTKFPKPDRDIAEGEKISE